MTRSISLRAVTFALIVVLSSAGCILENAAVLLSARPPAVARIADGERVHVEPFVDGRGMAILGRMRNGYAWPMGAYVLGAEQSPDRWMTSQVVDLLRRSGFDVVETAGDASAGLVLRGHVVHAYGDFIYTLETRTRVRLDLWLGDEFIESVTYDGLANPFGLEPTGLGSQAFSESFSQLLAAMGRELPDRLLRLAQSGEAAK